MFLPWKLLAQTERLMDRDTHTLKMSASTNLDLKLDGVAPLVKDHHCANSIPFYNPRHSNLIHYITQLATDSGSSGNFFCQVKSGPPSLKTDCLKKRKLALTRSTWGQPLSSLNAP